jgi:hypothetical protein
MQRGRTFLCAGEFEEKAIFLECISNLALRLGRPTDTLEDPQNKNRRPNQGGGQSIFYMR